MDTNTCSSGVCTPGPSGPNNTGGDVLQTIDNPSRASATSVEVHEIVENEFLIEQTQTGDVDVDVNASTIASTGGLHVCRVCGKQFAKARILQRHAKIHLECKPHRCTECDMSFAASSNLSKHKRTHTGEKPHACSMCPRRFDRKQTLAAHLAIHVQDENALDWPVCLERFPNHSSFKKHQRTHAAQIYFCKNCDFQASSYEAVQEHMNIMHPYNAEKTVGEDPLKVPLNVGVDGVPIVQTLEDNA